MSCSKTEKILIVDDSPLNLAAFTAMLEPLGCELLSAASGEEALRLVLQHDVALILLDVRMPGLDGYETARFIRQRERSRRVPIIFLTAATEEAHCEERGYAAGAVDFIIKPVDPNTLRSKATVFLELHEKSRIVAEQAEQLRKVSEQRLADLRRRSEERYDSLADSVPLLIWTTDAEGHVIHRNRRWSDYTDGIADALDLSDILHPDDCAAFERGFAAALAKAQPFEGQFRLGDPARGEYRWHIARVLPVRSAAATPSGWIGTATDIDDQKRAQQALETLAAITGRLGDISEGTSALEKTIAVALPMLGDAGLLDLTEGTLAPCRIAVGHHGVSTPKLDDPRLDFAPSTVAFTTKEYVVRDLVAELDESNAHEPLLRFLNELGVSGYLCLPIWSRGRVLGSLTFLNAGSRRVYRETELTLAREVARRLGTALENRELYALAERERQRLVEDGQAKDVFLATLSHELRTPLNAIVGWAHLIKKGELGAEQHSRALDTIDRNARTLSKLVADLVDVSRIVSGKMNVDDKRLDFRQIVESALEALRPSATNANLTLEVALREGDATALGDAVRLQQVVSNVIGNAIKFTPCGGKIIIDLECREDRLRLKVSDTGPGIAKEFLPFVFEPFRQERRTHARPQEGLGLGLAIVRHLVELHGGSVFADSEGLGCGTMICVELPHASASNAREKTAPASSTAGTTDLAAAGQERLLAGLHALIVEDDPDGCELLRTVLSGFGATVTTAATVRDALSALDSQPPDVLVSDIGLPDEDGFSLLRRVRESARFGELPAIALTAYASKRDVAQALAAGFQAHVAKPVEPGELGATIARVSKRATMH